MADAGGDGYSGLFRYRRDGAEGRGFPDGVGGVCGSETAEDSPGSGEPEVRVQPRGMAHLPDFLPYRNGGRRTLCTEK